MGREVVDVLATDGDGCELTVERDGDCCRCGGRCIGEEMLLFDGATLFPDLRREPTRFFKRAFIDDMKGTRKSNVRKETLITRKKGEEAEPVSRDKAPAEPLQ